MSMSSLKLENDKPILNGKVGRRKKLTKEDVLKAIAKYQTTSPYELGEKLEVSHMTVYRILKKIPEEEITAMLQQLAEEELKPFEMEFEVFKTLPEVEEYIRTLQAQKLAKRYLNANIRGLWHLCVALKIRPKALTIEKLPKIRNYLLDIEHGKIKSTLNITTLTKATRLWYLYSVGLAKEKLNKYISSISPTVGKYAREKIPMELREQFLKELKNYLAEKNSLNEYPIYLSLVYWLFYTGTRIQASLNVNIEEITWKKDKGIVRVIDKGKHKLGRQKWDKIIIGELKKAIEYNLASRGNPKEGKLFPIGYDTAREVFNAVYKRIGVKYKSPMHIWRHTSAQELLDATGWNYDLVASILGWKDTRTLKACYGEMGEGVKINTLKKAMGEPIDEEPQIFRFSDKPIESFFISL